MKKKHYKIAAVLLAVTLGFFPIDAINAKTYVPSTGHSINHAAQDRKESPLRNEYVYKVLDDLYEVPTDQLEWWTIQITKASAEHEVPVDILISMLATESRVNINVISEPGTVGVSQIVSSVWKKRLKRTMNYDITKPEDNVLAGAYILSIYKNECRTWENAIKCYNVGDGSFKRKEKLAAQARYSKLFNIQLSRIKKYNATLLSV